jgi:O-antigen/teichoic acid export membrane protein
VRGLDATGVYAVAVQLAELLWLLSAALSTAAYRRIGAPDRAQAARVALQATGWGVAATLLAAPLLWVAAWAWLPLLVGAAYADALRPLALLLPGVVLYAAASAMSAFFTNHLGQPQWAARIAALSLVLNTLGCLWAVPRWGLDGAAASTSLSYALAIAVAWTQFARAAGVPWHAPWVARADRQSPP